MKDSVFNCFRDAILTRSSDWLRDLLLNDSADDVLAASKATIKLLLRVVKAATSGWEHVLEQLVKFALILMEMAAAAAGGSGSSSSSPDWEHSPLIPPSLSEDSQVVRIYIQSDSDFKLSFSYFTLLVDDEI